MTACVVPVATSEPSTSTPEISQFSTQTLTPFIAPTDTLVAATATETPIPTPVPSPRWFWAVSAGKNEILAFNAAGQVNTIFDFTDIIYNGNDLPPLRMSDDRAITFFVNHGKPKALLLTSDSATAIQIPNVQVPYPENPWLVAAEHAPYIIFTYVGTDSVPAILINAETGQASLVSDNVYNVFNINMDASFPLVRFSADGRSVRYATLVGMSGGPVEVHNLDLQNGKDTVFFQSSGHLSTDDFGEIWYDSRLGIVQTADGKSFTVTNTDANTWHILLKTGGILTTKRTCDSPCPLQTYPPGGESAASNYSLPASLINNILYVSYGQLLDQNRLLVVTYGNNITTNWILTSDGQGQLLGKGEVGYSATASYQSAFISSDGRYLLVYPTDDKTSFSVYELATGKVLFSETTVTPIALLNVSYFPEGIIVDAYDPALAIRSWVYNLATGLASEVGSLGSSGYCNAMTTDGKPICATDGGVVVYDPASGDTTLLIQEPVLQLSN